MAAATMVAINASSFVDRSAIKQSPLNDGNE
jgi:hypothetical protein